jgi:YegS/Rv2252/BmrU family lipid kinase
MGRRFFVIVNPAAGQDLDRVRLEEQVSARLGTAATFTEAAGDARRLAQRAVDEGVESLLVVGGDGTLSEVINGLRCCGEPGGVTLPTLTLLPAGTGNDFARSLDLSHEVDDALDRMLGGSTRAMDLLRVEAGQEKPRWMINVASGGFGREVADQTDEQVKQFWGAMAYVRVASGKLSDPTMYRSQMSFDGGEAVERNCLAVLVCNGRFVAGGRELLSADEAEPDDRCFHVITVTAETFYERLAIATRFLLDQHLGHDCVEVREARSLRIEAEPEMGFSVDGEPCAVSPITFTLEPRALRMTVSPASPL